MSKEENPFGLNETRRYVSKGGEDELFNQHRIGSSGEIELVDYMGGDDSVEYAATLGLGRGVFRESISQRDFLYHLSGTGIHTPFKSAQLKFSVQAPIRTALVFVYEPTCSVNEYSGRYSEMLDSAGLPNLERLISQVGEGKAQEILRVVTDLRKSSVENYHQLVKDLDMARELARGILGTNNDTRFYWKIDLPSLANFIQRYNAMLDQNDPTRVYLKKVSEIAKKVAPEAWNALMNDNNQSQALRLTMPSDEEVVNRDLSLPWWEPNLTRRVTVPEFDKTLFEIVTFLGHGQFMPIDYLGDDGSFAEAARTSYGKGTKTLLDDRRLVDSLIRDLHTSPVEMAEISFMTRAPVFTDPRQFGRHRTLDNDGFMGYTPIGSLAYFPDNSQFKHQDRVNQQGRGKEMEEQDRKVAQRLIQESFDEQLRVARELGELGAPEDLIREMKGVSFYTKRWRTGDVHNLQHMLGLRWEAHAQYEIQILAKIIANAHKLHTPGAYDSFLKHRKNAMRLSETEIDWMKNRGIINPEVDLENLTLYNGVPGFMTQSGKLGREGLAAQQKLKRLKK